MSTIEDLQQTLKELLTGDHEEATSAWLITKIPILMKTIEQANSIHKLAGTEKKNLLIQTINSYIKAEEDAHDEAALYFANHVLPSLIDTIIAVDTSKIRIKARNCINLCCPIA